MSNYPDPSEIEAAVVVGEAYVFVKSKTTAPQLWWAVEATSDGYKCQCEGFGKRRACRHTRAAWRVCPLVAPAPELDPDVGTDDWWDAAEAQWYTPGGAS